MTGFRLLLPIFLLTTCVLQAQQLSLFTQYRENAAIINPAAVEGDFLAFGQNLTFGASYRSQWTGISGAPVTQTLRGSYLHTDWSGVTFMAGGQLINDQTGPTGFTGFYGRFAGVLTSDPDYGGLSIGLSAGMVQFRVDAGDIQLRDENDILGAQDDSQFFPDVGLGIFFYRMLDGGSFDGDYIYGGVSVPQIIGLDLTFQNDNGEYFTRRVQHYYGLLGLYHFFDNDSFLEPSVWVKYVESAPISVDFNLRYQLPSSLWVGTGVGSSGTMHLEAGFLMGENVGFDNNFRVGYGYDYTFSDFGPTVGATHEINVALSLFSN